MLQISGFTSQLLLLVGIIRNIGPEHPLRPSSIEFQWLRPIQLLAKNCNSRPRSLLPAIFNGKIFDATWNILCFSSQLQSVLIIQTTSHKSLIRSNSRCFSQQFLQTTFMFCRVSRMSGGGKSYYFNNHRITHLLFMDLSHCLHVVQVIEIIKIWRYFKIQPTSQPQMLFSTGETISQKYFYSILKLSRVDNKPAKSKLFFDASPDQQSYYHNP